MQCLVLCRAMSGQAGPRFAAAAWWGIGLQVDDAAVQWRKDVSECGRRLRYGSGQGCLGATCQDDDTVSY